MISDLSFLCSTVTFAYPPTLRDHHNEQGTQWMCACSPFFFFFLQKRERTKASENDCVYLNLSECAYAQASVGADATTAALIRKILQQWPSHNVQILQSVLVIPEFVMLFVLFYLCCWVAAASTCACAD